MYVSLYFDASFNHPVKAGMQLFSAFLNSYECTHVTSHLRRLQDPKTDVRGCATRPATLKSLRPLTASCSDGINCLVFRPYRWPGLSADLVLLTWSPSRSSGRHSTLATRVARGPTTGQEQTDGRTGGVR